MYHGLIILQIALAIGKGDAVTVIERSNALLEGHPKNIFALSVLALQYQAQKESDKALYYAETALDQDPGNLQMIRLLADIYIEKGQYENAYRCADQILAVSANKPKNFFHKIKNALLPKAAPCLEDWLKWAQDYKEWYEKYRQP